MLIETEDDRLALDEAIQARLGGGIGPNGGAAALLRGSLSVLPPQQLVGIWFGSAAPNVPLASIAYVIRALSEQPAASDTSSESESDATPPVRNYDLHDVVGQMLANWIAKARSLIPRRALLFAWVYGPSPAVRELVHVRLPSRERRLLIDMVITGVRRRYSWLKNRHVCALAFRTGAFSSLRSAPEGRNPWGPLYRRVVIQQGRKTRHLWIPNRVLMSVQKSLLQLLHPTADQAIGSYVFGARRGVTGPTFTNASMHMHRSMIASFDIKDFFPSTSAADVIRGLQHIGTREPLAVDPSRSWLYPDFLADGSRLKAIPWTDELRVFVARIGTHRGRLPQGSPLSPLLANIAFSPYDDRLVKLLEQEFGRGRVKYTRYFDDMTISAMPPQGAGSRMSPAAFSKRCELVIAKVLAGSSYCLNGSKTRSSTAVDGHVVTGVMVRRNTLHLPRAQRREIRTVLHALRHRDFVQTASRWRQLAGRPNVRFESIRRGHRFVAGPLKARRMSAERLATLMLRHLYPDLKLRRLLSDWHPWQEKVDSADDCVAGKKMWPLIEWVLAARWTGAVHPHRPNDDAGMPILNRIILRQKDSDVCILEAESNLDFFFLSRDDAVATTEYWHHLRGMTAYLNGCPEGEPFSQIRALGESLREACATIEVCSTLGEQVVVQEPVVSPPVTTGEYFERLTAECDEWLQHHLHVNGVSPGRGFGEAREIFRRERAITWASLLRWLRAANALTTELCPLLPAGPVSDSHISPETLFQYLRWRSAIDKGLAKDDYKCVRAFQEKTKIGPDTTSSHLNRVQGRIAESLLAYFRVSPKVPQSGGSDHTIVNHWHGEVADRLRDQLNVFEEFHLKARSTNEGRRLLRIETWPEVIAVRDAVLNEPNRHLTPTLVWAGLEKNAKKIYIAVVESMEDVICTDVPPENEPSPEAWRRRQLWKQSQLLVADTSMLRLIDSLRNRESHGRSPERRPEWVGIQNKVATVLGRGWRSLTGRKHPNYSAPDDLVLTAYEGHVVTMEMLLAVNQWLGRIVELQWWKPTAAAE